MALCARSQGILPDDARKAGDVPIGTAHRESIQGIELLVAPSQGNGCRVERSRGSWCLQLPEAFSQRLIQQHAKGHLALLTQAFQWHRDIVVERQSRTHASEHTGFAAMMLPDRADGACPEQGKRPHTEGGRRSTAWTKG